jgi:hypothetical protein
MLAALGRHGPELAQAVITLSEAATLTDLVLHRALNTQIDNYRQVSHLCGVGQARARAC